MRSISKASAGADGPSDGAFSRIRSARYFPAFGGQLLAVAQTADGTIGRKDNGGGENRTEERASADLVDAGDPADTLGSGLALVLALTAS